MTKKKFMMGTMSLLAAFMLAACNSDDEGMNPDEQMEMDSDEGMGMEGMNHSSSGEVPEDLAEEESPTYEVGSQAMIEADHMEGMNGAEATIVGAYYTTAYALTYTPTTGGEPVENHKWVIHEELENPGDLTTLNPGDEATLAANHMEGMDGATASIDSVQGKTVYMVDFTPTTGGEEVVNYKWLIENELSAE